MTDAGTQSRELTCGSGAMYKERESNTTGAVLACAGAATECAAKQSEQCDSL